MTVSTGGRFTLVTVQVKVCVLVSSPSETVAVTAWVPALATVAVVAEFGLPFRSTATELAVFAALTAA